MRTTTMPKMAKGQSAALIAVAMLGLFVFIFMAGSASAGRDDTTLIGLRVTVTDVAAGTVTVEIEGRGLSSVSLASARLGSQFYYDASTFTGLDAWVTPVPPAVDWGDGNSIANIGIPFSMQTTTTASGEFISSFRSEFMHTYLAPGNYTIRSFGTNVYASITTSPDYGITEGNTFSALSPAIAYDSGASTATIAYSTIPIGVTNTDMASVTTVGNGGGDDSGGGGGGCGLIGIELLVVYPVWAQSRRRRAAQA